MNNTTDNQAVTDTLNY